MYASGADPVSTHGIRFGPPAPALTNGHSSSPPQSTPNRSDACPADSRTGSLPPTAQGDRSPLARSLRIHPRRPHAKLAHRLRQSRHKAPLPTNPSPGQRPHRGAKTARPPRHHRAHPPHIAIFLRRKANGKWPWLQLNCHPRDKFLSILVLSRRISFLPQ